MEVHRTCFVAEQQSETDNTCDCMRRHNSRLIQCTLAGHIGSYSEISGIVAKPANFSEVVPTNLEAKLGLTLS
jgi:hypothetical protein